MSKSIYLVVIFMLGIVVGLISYEKAIWYFVHQTNFREANFANHIIFDKPFYRGDFPNFALYESEVVSLHNYMFLLSLLEQKQYEALENLLLTSIQGRKDTIIWLDIRHQFFDMKDKSANQLKCISFKKLRDLDLKEKHILFNQEAVYGEQDFLDYLVANCGK